MLLQKRKISFFVMAEEYCSVYMHHIFFISSSLHGHVGCPPILAVINNAAVNMGVHISFQIGVFVFLG